MIDHLTMVVPREILLGRDYFEGFRGAGEVDYESRILNNYEYQPRDRAEEEPRWKQPIAYALIVNPRLRLIFAYQRSKRGDQYPEERLQGKWSWGVGGHIDKADIRQGNPIQVSLAREVSEELGRISLDPPEVLGYINDDATPVGRVHFGILYLLKTAEEEIHPLSPEIADGGLRPVSQLLDFLHNPETPVEEWSALALPPLLDLLGRSEEKV